MNFAFFWIGQIIVTIVYVDAQMNPTQSDPTIYSWSKYSGSDSDPTDIDRIEYSANFVYIHSTGIPSYYSTSSWHSSHARPTDQKVSFKLSRNVGFKEAAKNKIKASQRVGYLCNGVSVYNTDDDQSYLNLGTNIFNIEHSFLNRYNFMFLFRSLEEKCLL